MEWSISKGRHWFGPNCEEERVRAGNAIYKSLKDLPDTVPVFPLSAALLLPGTRMPLNVFEPRYLEMVDHVLGAGRLIGMIQPSLDGTLSASGEPALCEVGCLGRLTSFSETGDGRYLITLDGVCRFRVNSEIRTRLHYRKCSVTHFAGDLVDDDGGEIDRAALLHTFRAYLDANDLEADWESIRRAENCTLVNALSMMSPYGPAEKQALLEAPDLKTRAETLIAITEIALAREGGEEGTNLQ
jgi:Lon protease-like protein